MSAPVVHPTALVDPGAELANGVHVGPNCVVGPRVILGPDCRLDANVVLEGPTRVGPGCHFYPFSSIGSDPQRQELASAEFADEVHDTPYGRYLHVENTGGYVAPPLTALWATAPYLHNGSVPTLWHLMHPGERPEQFMVGGHMLDFERVGIAGRLDDAGVYRYPDAYTPWSSPTLYDTRSLGRDRSGHEAQFLSLTEEQKRALLEYLKLP